MMAKPMKTLELHYPMIQFLIICIIHFTSYRVVSLRAAWVTFDAPGWRDRDPYGIHTFSLSYNNNNHNNNDNNTNHNNNDTITIIVIIINYIKGNTEQ